MSDLIQRLRDAAIYGPIPCPVCDEAADRIAALEAENAALVAEIPISTGRTVNEVRERLGPIRRIKDETGPGERAYVDAYTAREVVGYVVGERDAAKVRIAALESEKAERERQEPVAYVTDEPSPNPEPIAWSADWRRLIGRKLYAHPLAIRELTDEECERVGEIFAATRHGNTYAERGRAMANAVREVMK